MFLLKGYLTLAGADPGRESFWVARAQPLVDRLTTGAEPMNRRLIEGLSVVFRGDAESKDVALTFDGGPAPDTGKLLDLLKAEGVKATFFLLGCFAGKDPATSRRIAAEGHVIANHTMTHAHWKGLAKIPPEAGDKDVLQGIEVISKVTGVGRIELFRPPYGSGAERKDICARLARVHPYSILWTIDTWDSLGAPLDKQIRRVLESKKLPGAIILCHDHSKTIVPLVQRIIPELKRRGYRFVTVTEMIAQSERALRARRLAELCVKLQNLEAKGAVLARAALDLGRERGDDRTLLEALDLAYLIARLHPDRSLAADAVRAEIAGRFSSIARWASGGRPSVVE